MRATLVLCDAAQAVGGKLYILGGGWSFITPGASAMALAILVEVPWTATNEPHTLHIQLVDQDEQPVLLGPENKPVTIDGTLEVGRPPGHPQGTPLNVPIAFTIPPLPLAPSQRYVWVLSVDGETDDNWRVAFNTRAQPRPRPPLAE